jgi:hypothetical protein
MAMPPTWVKTLVGARSVVPTLTAMSGLIR